MGAGATAAKWGQRFLAGVGAITISSGVLAAWGFKRFLGKKYDTTLPASFILEVDLEDIELVEKQHGGFQTLLAAGKPKLELSKAVTALKAAGADERVVGLLGLIGPLGGEAGLAQVQELRQAVLGFREMAAGRAASVAYADSFGEGGAFGTMPYYLASAFEHVYMPHTGLLSLTGLAASQPFARGLLDRLRIKPVVIQREEYKSAMSPFTNSGFTDAEREATASLINDIGNQIVRDVAAARALTAQQVLEAVDAAPHGAEHAQQLRLIDGQLYRDQAMKVLERMSELKQLQHGQAMVAALVKAAGAAAPAGLQEAAGAQPAGTQPAAEAGVSAPEAGEVTTVASLLEQPDAEAGVKLPRVQLQRYIHVLEVQEAKQHKEHVQSSLNKAVAELRDTVKEMQDDKEEGLDEAQQARSALLKALQLPTVAVLTLSGPIMLGRDEHSPAATGGRSTQIASLPVIHALQQVGKSPQVKAVVLRIDSPGGSAVASDAIHREVARLRAAGKPIIVSMGNVAASGGYYIAAPATKILAQASTLTGSIGVITGKFILDEFLRDKLSINSETIKFGQNADMASPLAGFTKEQEAQANAHVDAVYSAFLRVVAEGRGMALEAVRSLAKGRVWTGRQACEAGLVDRLGGLQDAIQLAKQEAGLPLEEGAVLVRDVYPDTRSPFGKFLDFVRGRNAGMAATGSLDPLAAVLLGAVGSGGGGQQQQQLVDTLLRSLQLPGCLGQGGGMAPQAYSVQAQRLLSSLRG